jgi:hypothetical protein
VADFLSRLADRTLGTAASAVRPRLAPLYASGADSVASFEQPDTLLEARDPVVESGESEPTDERDTPRIRRRTTLTAQDASDAGARPAAPRRSETRVSSERGAEPASKPVQLVSPSRTPAATQPNVPADATPTVSPGVRVAASAQGRLEDRPPSTHSPRPVPLVPPALSPYQVADTREREAAIDGPDRAARPRPTVRVTIGRIDVRAVLPAPRAEPARPPPGPRLTLQEYVRQRRQGER